eukprot:5641843-Pleurochrysis_carterae.AAC.1
MSETIKLNSAYAVLPSHPALAHSYSYIVDRLERLSVCMQSFNFKVLKNPAEIDDHQLFQRDSVFYILAFARSATHLRDALRRRTRCTARSMQAWPSSEKNNAAGRELLEQKRAQCFWLEPVARQKKSMGLNVCDWSLRAGAAVDHVEAHDGRTSEPTLLLQHR